MIRALTTRGTEETTGTTVTAMTGIDVAAVATKTEETATRGGSGMMTGEAMIVVGTVTVTVEVEVEGGPTMTGATKLCCRSIPLEGAQKSTIFGCWSFIHGLNLALIIGGQKGVVPFLRSC